MPKDSIETEQTYNVKVIEDPEEANHIYDSVEDTFHRFNAWSDTHDAFHVKLDNNDTITVRKYLHPSNRYYLTKSSTFEDNR